MVVMEIKGNGSIHKIFREENTQLVMEVEIVVVVESGAAAPSFLILQII
jgi:hypothetical protein